MLKVSSLIPSLCHHIKTATFSSALKPIFGHICCTGKFRKPTYQKNKCVDRWQLETISSYTKIEWLFRIHGKWNKIQEKPYRSKFPCENQYTIFKFYDVRVAFLQMSVSVPQIIQVKSPPCFKHDCLYKSITLKGAIKVEIIQAFDSVFFLIDKLHMHAVGLETTMHPLPLLLQDTRGGGGIWVKAHENFWYW